MLQLGLLNETHFREPRRRLAVQAVAVAVWVQLDLLAAEWLNRTEEETDDDPFLAPVVHRIVLALEAEPPQTSGIRSVFDLPAIVLSMPARPAKPEPARERHGITTREVGVTRHTARRYDETPEWQEKERKRRAKQRVPKPTKRARTRGRKLLDLIGPEADEA